MLTHEPSCSFGTEYKRSILKPSGTWILLAGVAAAANSKCGFVLFGGAVSFFFFATASSPNNAQNNNSTKTNVKRRKVISSFRQGRNEDQPVGNQDIALL